MTILFCYTALQPCHFYSSNDATFLFTAYLDPDTATKIQVCSGAGSVGSAVPSKVKKFIDEQSIDVMEKRRIAFFDPPEGVNDSFTSSTETDQRIPWSTLPP